MKKLLITLVAGLVSVNAMAFVGPNSSWEAIFADYSTRYTTSFDDGIGQIRLENACVSDTEIKTIKPVTVCAEYKEVKISNGEDGDRYEYQCVATKQAMLAQPRTYTRTVCTDLRNVQSGDESHLECFAWGPETKTIPNTISVNVWEENVESSTWPGFAKSFTFPACN